MAPQQTGTSQRILRSEAGAYLAQLNQNIISMSLWK
ncbi:Uncharacterised protein [Actinobacillus equuli]|nr:Uncharacterised protein [Actinobacillus equuli]